MKALSLKQPWAYMIVKGIKDIENRKWSTKFRGKVLIHASKQFDNNAYIKYKHLLPDIEQIQLGGIVGEVEIVDCVTKSNSSWFFGPYGFVIKNPKELPFRPYKGQLMFFNVD